MGNRFYFAYNALLRFWSKPEDNLKLSHASRQEHTPDLWLSTSSGESILSSVEQSSSSEENNLRHLQKGSLIQLSSGQTKKVEDLETEDFICSARSNPDITLDHSTLVQIELKTTNGFQKVID